MKHLTELADSVRQARFGRVLVLAGVGTGKTVLARSLAQDLGYYLVDLSAAVSKYVGETEQNLARLLAPADNSASVLFFDEADSLFGQRTGIKDAHDRYADFSRALRSARGLVVLGVERPEQLPRELRDQARIVTVRDYWPPRYRRRPLE